MRTTIISLALVITAVSCNDSKTDNTAAIKELNGQSLECIRIINKADAQKNAAMASGDADLIKASQQTMDSAAKENAKIGQQILELQAKQ